MKRVEEIKHYFSKKEWKELDLIKQRIKATGKIKAIILFGSHARGQQLHPLYAFFGKKVIMIFWLFHTVQVN